MEKDHKFKDLAREIDQEFFKVCNINACGECKYAFMPNCRTLFVLDYLESKKRLGEIV